MNCQTSWRPDKDPTVTTRGDVILFGHDGTEFRIERQDIRQFIDWIRLYGDQVLLLSASAEED